MHVVSAMRLVSRKRPVATLGGAPRRPGDPRPRRAAARDDRRRGAAAARSWSATCGPGGWTGSSCPGRVDREGLRPLHQSADAYLTTARLEAFGIAALEARAAGLPVVAPRGTGVDDFVADGVEGLLAESDVLLAGALAHLAGDPALRARIRAHNLAVPPTAGLARGRRRRRCASTTAPGCARA